MNQNGIEIGDPIKASPVGPGTVTGITEAGYPQVNHVAVAWLEREDGAVFDPWGKHGGTRGPAPGVSASSEPIPPRAYWAPLADNFYNAEGYGLGLDFYRKWRPRRSEFPQGEAAGWGPNSAHNPFKDAPRNAGVKGPEHG